MTARFRALERLDDRVLCAFRCVDATTRAAVDVPLRIRSIAPPHPRLRSNSRGLLVVTEWAPLEQHNRAFAAPPAEPATESLPLILAVEDPQGRYLPRLMRVSLPRIAAPSDPAAAATPSSLFVPIEVPMYAAAAAAVEANWAVVRVSVISGADEALGGVLLRVRRNGTVMATGLSDWRGEALVAIAGVPIISFSDNQDAALTSDLEVVLEGVFDPGAGTRTPLAQVRDGRPPPLLPLVDPEALDAAGDQVPGQQRTLRIAARRQITTTLQIDIP
jgi:hypothetical protein